MPGARRCCVPLSVAVAFVVAGACATDGVSYLGRPCSSSEPCGGGTVCDLTLGVCVATDAASGTSDFPRLDHAPGKLDGDASRPGDGDASRPGDGPSRDGTLPDKRPGVDRAPTPDLMLAPDGGCPSPLTRCGAVCVNTSTTFAHCGGCNKPCSSTTADACAQGQCVCGAGSSYCTTGICYNAACCIASCSGKVCGSGNGCGGTCTAGSGCCTPQCSGKVCGSSDSCTGTCAYGSGCTCPTCASLGYYTGSMVACKFTGSSCVCPGTDSNSNNQCDSGESCWGWNNCPTGSSTICHTKKNITVPSGCPAISYCMDC